jgi:hypothetical protein
MTVVVSSGGLCPSNSKPEVFPNFAGHPDIDDACAAELTEAGILVHKFEFLKDQHPEVKTSVRGTLNNWIFQRYWYYWTAKGPGIPPSYANKLHEEFGQEARVDGHCGCPSPLEWFHGFAVNHYHVDTQRGLNALAAVIRQVVDDSGVPFKTKTAGHRPMDQYC